MCRFESMGSKRTVLFSSSFANSAVIGRAFLLVCIHPSTIAASGPTPLLLLNYFTAQVDMASLARSLVGSSLRPSALRSHCKERSLPFAISLSLFCILESDCDLRPNATTTTTTKDSLVAIVVVKVPVGLASV